MRRTKMSGLLAACMLLLIFSCKKQDNNFAPVKQAAQTNQPSNKRVNFVPLTIHTPAAGRTDSYPRLVRLANGTDLLASRTSRG